MQDGSTTFSARIFLLCVICCLFHFLNSRATSVYGSIISWRSHLPGVGNKYLRNETLGGDHVLNSDQSYGLHRGSKVALLGLYKGSIRNIRKYDKKENWVSKSTFIPNSKKWKGQKFQLPLSQIPNVFIFDFGN